MNMAPPTDELTADFIETFATKQDCTGVMASMIATGNLPEGVDAAHPYVRQIVKWCQENNP